MTAVADTSFILAYMNKDDAWHVRCRAVFKAQEAIHLPQSTLLEITYMLGRSGGNKRVAYFLNYLPTVEKLKLTTFTPEDLARTAELLEKYADTRIDFVDASVAAVAERLNITRILSLDQRDFQILRPKHVDHFEVLPQP